MDTGSGWSSWVTVGSTLVAEDDGTNSTTVSAFTFDSIYLDTAVTATGSNALSIRSSGNFTFSGSIDVSGSMGTADNGAATTQAQAQTYFGPGGLNGGKGGYVGWWDGASGGQSPVKSAPPNPQKA